MLPVKCQALTKTGKQCTRDAVGGSKYCWQHRNEVEEKQGEERNKVGRPTTYREEYAKQAYKLCLLGAIDKDLADFFEVTEQTINNWKKEYPEFFESIKRGKMIADAEIAEKLYHRAKGYSCTDTKFATHEGKITDSVEYVKHYPPDTTAIIFWLKNRQPDKWRDKQDIDLDIGSVQIIDDIE